MFGNESADKKGLCVMNLDAFLPILKSITTLEEAMDPKMPGLTWRIRQNRSFAS